MVREAIVKKTNRPAFDTQRLVENIRPHEVGEGKLDRSTSERTGEFFDYVAGAIITDGQRLGAWQEHVDITAFLAVLVR